MCYFYNFRTQGHFKIKINIDIFFQIKNILILNMTSIFPQMNSNLMGTRLLHHSSGL